jgi:hypothetical protein
VISAEDAAAAQDVPVQVTGILHLSQLPQIDGKVAGGGQRVGLILA